MDGEWLNAEVKFVYILKDYTKFDCGRRMNLNESTSK